MMRIWLSLAFRRWRVRRKCVKAGHPLECDEWATHNFKRFTIFRSCRCREYREFVSSNESRKIQTQRKADLTGAKE